MTCGAYALEVIAAMCIEWTDQFDAYVSTIEDEAAHDAVSARRFAILAALLTSVRALEGPLVSGFDKASLGDIWYDRAVAESGPIIEAWLRANPGREGQS
jgi:hypothetical protein